MIVKTLAKQDFFPSLKPITSRYLLVNFCIPFYIDAQGRRYLDKLWVKDLVEHFKYLKNFTLASPCRYENPPEGAIPLDSNPAFAPVQFIDLPAPNSSIDALKLLPKTVSKLWKAVGEADIVHGGVAGWPIPEGWLLTPMVRLRKKFYLIIVESAFWRLSLRSPKSLLDYVRAHILERGNRWCVNNANLAIFTQEQYRRSLLTRAPERGHVINASWIDEQVIVSDAVATDLWNQKLASYATQKELRILFAGRLIASKGVLVLLEAMKSLKAEGMAVKLDILGEGDLSDECDRASQDVQPPHQIRRLGTVPYGPKFFDLLRDYHAVVIPSLSDEQPRIIYDAYSQAIPVLGSDTDGIRDCVRDGETGRLAASNDPAALAALLEWAAENPAKLSKMGSSSLKTALGLTHQEMHRRRWQILLESLDESHATDSHVLVPVQPEPSSLS